MKTKYLATAAIVVTALTLLLASCGNGANTNDELARIDSTMEINPEAAYDCLLHIDSTEKYGNDKEGRMRLRLLTAKAQNKLYITMPTDSVFREVVNYYDRYGNANDRMLSHYLLGCIYRDMDKGPKAIECLMNAAESADTTDKDCDYKTLSRIHGQMAELLKYGFQPKEALDELQNFILYAEKAGDSIGACYGHESMIYQYYSLGDTISAINKVEECHNLFNKRGMKKDAASVYPILIYIYLERKQFDKARQYMDIYEGESGLFDSSGNICAGRENYYKARGMYSLGTGNIDSAEYYYRKLKAYNFNYESAQGLLSVYSIKNNQDSILKYTKLCETEMDSILTRKNAYELILSSSSHNYNKIKTATQRTKHITTNMLLILTAIILVMLFGGKIIFHKHTKNTNKISNSLAAIKEAYIAVSNSHRQAMHDVDELKSKLNKLKASSSMESLKESHIYQVLKENARSHSRDIHIAEKEWNSFEQLFSHHFPLLYNVLVKKKSLSCQELKVCMLLWTGFDNCEIIKLINCTAQAVSNAKANANEKIFSERSAKSLLSNMNKAYDAALG